MLRRMLRGVLATLLLSCMLAQVPVSAFAASTLKVSVSVEQDYKSAQRVLKLINARRRKAGLRAVKLDKKLTKSAIQRAAEVGIYTPQESPHRRPNGKLARSVNRKISYEICAESTGGSRVTDAQIVKGWMASPPHKKGILLKSARSVGIACINVGPGSYVWVCEFSNKKAAKVLKSAKQGVKLNKTVAAKAGYLAKKYFKLGYASSPNSELYDDLWMGYPVQLAPLFEGRYVYGPTSLNAKSFTWKTSNPSVAAVSAAGKVTPKAPGRVTITATMKSRSSIQLKHTFEVYGD